MADWKDQSLRLWQALSSRQKYLIVGVALLIFSSILIWSYWWGGHSDNVPLFTNLDAQDAGDVAAKLKELKIPYEIGGNGTAIMVASKDVYRIRLDLASQGLPRGSKGFEIFDQNKFGATEFQNKVYYLQALQGELTRTIEEMAEVERARVHIVLSEDSLYKKNEKPATASIMLKLRPSTELSQDQVQGIVNLVAHSIQGLKPENITVVDSYARILNAQNGEGLPTAGTLTQLEITAKVRDDLQKSAQSLLDQVLGPGKAAIRIRAELDFDQKTVDRQVFQPVVDDKGIIRSSQETSESFQGNAPPTGGVPGTTSNIPGYVTSSSSQSTYEKKEATRNYEVNQENDKVVVAPGSIHRLTVAVMVDSTVPKVQQDAITKAISSAVGFDATRGDVISVESLPFSTELADKQLQEEQAYNQEQNRMLWLKIGAAIAGILIFFFFLRNFMKRRQEAEEDDMQMTAIQVMQDQRGLEKSAGELTPEESERLQQREAIIKLARTKPDDVAQMIKTWLTEE